MSDLRAIESQLAAWGGQIARMTPRSHERVVLERKMFELRTKLMFATFPPRHVPVPPAYVIRQPVEARHE